MDVRFVIVAPASARKSFRVRLPVVVGRGDEAKLRIQQDSVSRRHCEFTHDGLAVAVTDLGSTNGTIVAGTRIAAHAATAVPSGAEVRIGSIVLRVEYATAKHSASSAPAAVAPHEADTVPLLAAASAESSAELPELEPLPELELVGETTAGEQAAAGDGAAASVDGPTLAAAPAFPDAVSAATTASEPAFPDVEPAAPAAEVPAFPDLDPAPPPADGSFDFLAGDPAPPPADDTLDDFFKSLS